MAAEQIPGGYQSIALVDLSYLFKKNWLGAPRDAAPGAAAQKTLDQLAGVRESVEHVIVCCDSPPYRRKEVDPEYKALRERPTDEEVSQKKWLMERIEKDGYRIAKAKGYEADDVIHTLCKAYWWCPDVRIVGNDKDCAQCVTDSVRMFVPAVGTRQSEVRGPKEIQAKYGVPPADMHLWLALVGDDSDNIPGVPGIGPKKAAQLIRDCKSVTGIAEALAMSREDDKPSAMWQSLADHWEQLIRSHKLAELEEAPLNVVELLEKLEPQPLDTEAMQNGHDTTPDAEWDPISRAPENYVPPAAKVEQKPEAKPDAIVKTSPDFGVVNEDLQPQDLTSARNIAKWVHSGRLYPQFPTAESVFTIILRGKELGVGVTTSLAGFHLIEGKPSASADLIRSLAERDPHCEYFRLVSSSTKEATWETKHRGHPTPTSYTYTIEEADQAGLRGGNWQKRPRDMLTKTAGSKLARLVYPGSTIGLYCPEEMDP
jgi:5'-3' exonuclease